MVTGPSGSGKSSLAFDTIYAEGQRRYVESLSAYARQFLERMEKPDVDWIDGLSPAVAIEQKNPTKTSRSTVGTATETYDYLRLLWARVGHTSCPVCGREMKPDTVQSAADEIMALPGGTRFFVAFPLRLSSEVTHDLVVENLRAQGFLRVSADGDIVGLDELGAKRIDLTKVRELLVIVDRLTVSAESRQRLSEAIATCFAEGDGECVVAVRAGGLPPPIFRAVRVRVRRDARPDAHAAAVLVQQSARRVPHVQRVRRHAGVRRGADRSASRALASRRRNPSVDDAAIRQQAARAGRIRETLGYPARRALALVRRGAAA